MALGEVTWEEGKTTSGIEDFCPVTVDAFLQLVRNPGIFAFAAPLVKRFANPFLPVLLEYSLTLLEKIVRIPLHVAIERMLFHCKIIGYQRHARIVQYA